MAVYTILNSYDIEQILSNYNIGKFDNFFPIESGTENSNYLIKCADVKYILTIYEKRVKSEDLPFYLELMYFLNQANIPCPTPIKTKSGDVIVSIKNKFATIVSFLEGKSSTKITSIQTEQLGKHIALMHKSSLNFPLTLKNNFSLDSWSLLFNNIKKNEAEELKPGISDEIASHLNFIKGSWPTNLPQGIIHGDLFPDNVFFKGDKISGIIDFYFSCYDFLMYDIAICLNAWCFESSGEFNLTKAKSLLQGYNSIRKISEAELSALPILASGAALRFLLTRLYDNLNNKTTALVKLKNPLEYLAKLRFHHNIKSHLEYGM